MNDNEDDDADLQDVVLDDLDAIDDVSEEEDGGDHHEGDQGRVSKVLHINILVLVAFFTVLYKTVLGLDYFHSFENIDSFTKCYVEACRRDFISTPY